MSSQITVTMSADTVGTLHENGSTLYVLQQVRTASGLALPCIWGALTSYSATTSISWTEDQKAYTSSTSIKAGNAIAVGFSSTIRDGQELVVTAGGVGTIKAGAPSVVSIMNTTTTQFATGLARSLSSGASVPTYAEPLFGLNTVTTRATETALLLFSTLALEPGTLVQQFPVARDEHRASTTSLGLLVDASSPRVVNYDLNAGWTWGGGAWASTVPSNAALVPLLIRPPAPALRAP